MERLVSILSLSLCLCGNPLSAAEPTDEFASSVEDICRDAVESGRTVGLSVAVARADTVLFAEGFGLANAELNVPATSETVYRIGSVTKEFTAAAVLLLVEDGRITLDAPVSEYLPDYPAHAQAVTARHLLQHTSGVKDFTRLPDYRKERPLDVTQLAVLERFQHLPLDFAPGEKYRYCNSGYFLLALIIEKVTEKTYREFLEERLFFKLGLRRTYCDHAARIIPGRASGYTMWGGDLRNAPFISLNQTLGAGNLASTVTDLIAWQRGLMKHRLLRSESIRAMTTRGRLAGGRQFNYGFGIRPSRLDGKAVLRHGGGISGFRADLAYYPDSDVTIAVLANSDGFNTARLSDQIARHYFKVTAGAALDPSTTTERR